MKTTAVISIVGGFLFAILAMYGNGMFGIPPVLWWIPCLFSVITAFWAVTDSLEGVITCGGVVIITGVVAPYLESLNLPWFYTIQRFVLEFITNLFL